MQMPGFHTSEICKSIFYSFRLQSECYGSQIPLKKQVKTSLFITCLSFYDAAIVPHNLCTPLLIMGCILYFVSMQCITSHNVHLKLFTYYLFTGMCVDIFCLTGRILNIWPATMSKTKVIESTLWSIWCKTSCRIVNCLAVLYPLKE